MVNTKDMSQEEGANSSSSTEPLAAVSPNSPVTLSFRRIQALPSGEPQAVVPSYSKDRESYNQGVPPLIVVKPANWQVTNMALLLRKAGSVYHSLASVSNTNGKYGRGLRFCKLALKCLGSVQSLQSFSEEQKYLLGSVLCACADSCLMLAKFQGNLSVHYEDFNYLSPDDQFIASSADACMQNSPVETLSTTVQFILDKEKSLLKRYTLTSVLWSKGELYIVTKWEERSTVVDTEMLSFIYIYSFVVILLLLVIGNFFGYYFLWLFIFSDTLLSHWLY